MNNKKQYYNNLNPGETSIESRTGAKIVMNNNITISAVRRQEYLDQLRQEGYQGNINPSLDEDTSMVYMGIGQVTLDEQGNVTQLSLGVQQSENVITAQQTGVNTSVPCNKPVITKLESTTFKGGEEITIKGLNFIPGINSNKILVNDKILNGAVSEFITPNEILVTIPSVSKEVKGNISILIYCTDNNGENTFAKSDPYKDPSGNDIIITIQPNIEEENSGLPSEEESLIEYRTDNDDEGEELGPGIIVPTLGGKGLPSPRAGGGGGGGRATGGGRGGGRAGWTRDNYTISERLDAIDRIKNANGGSIAVEIKSSNPLTSANQARLKTLAEQELTLWNNGGRKATRSQASEGTDLFTALLKYSGSKSAANAILGGRAWSAYFISWIANQIDSTFPKYGDGASHYKYSVLNRSSLWEIYPLDNDRDSLATGIKVKVEIGDIYINPRGTKYESHGDIVYKIEGNKAYLVGGNLSNSVKNFTIDISSDGYYNFKSGSKLIVLKRK